MGFIEQEKPKVRMLLLILMNVRFAPSEGSWKEENNSIHSLIGHILTGKFVHHPFPP